MTRSPSVRVRAARRLLVERVTLPVADALSAIAAYEYAWVMRQDGWFIFSTPLGEAYTLVSHQYGVIALAVIIAMAMFRLYRLEVFEPRSLVIRSITASATALLTLMVYHVATVGGSDVFPLSLWVVFGTLLTVGSLMYRIAIWAIVYLTGHGRRLGVWTADRTLNLSAHGEIVDQFDEWTTAIEEVRALESLGERASEVATADSVLTVAVEGRLLTFDAGMARETLLRQYVQVRGKVAGQLREISELSDRLERDRVQVTQQLCSIELGLDPSSLARDVLVERLNRIEQLIADLRQISDRGRLVVVGPSHGIALSSRYVFPALILWRRFSRLAVAVLPASGMRLSSLAVEKLQAIVAVGASLAVIGSVLSDVLNLRVLASRVAVIAFLALGLAAVVRLFADFAQLPFPAKPSRRSNYAKYKKS